MKKIIVVAFIMSVVNKSIGQSNETMFSFDYSLAPIRNDDIDFHNINLGILIPVKLKKGLLVNTLELGFYELNYSTDYSFSTTEISKINDLSYGLKYTYPLSNTWKLNTQIDVLLVTNSIDNINRDNLFLGGEVTVTKLLGAKVGSETLTLGANYTTITGTPEFLPTISYINQVSDKWHYKIGFPEMYVVYKLNKLSTFKSLLSLDGLYSNLDIPVTVNMSSEASKASFSSTSLGLEYHYKMDDNWSILFKGGYLFTNKYKLLDSENNEIFDFETVPKPIFSAGIKFNIKKANTNRL